MPDPARFTIRFAINFMRHHLKEFIGEGNAELMLAELGTVDQSQVLKRFADWLEEPQAIPQLERVIRQAEVCFQESRADRALKSGISQLSLVEQPALIKALAGLENDLDEKGLRAALASAFQAYSPQLEKATLEQGADEYLFCLRQSLLSHKESLPKVVGLAVLRMERTLGEVRATVEEIKNNQVDLMQEGRQQHAQVMEKLAEVGENVSQPKRIFHKPWQAPPLPPHFVPRPEKNQNILDALVAETQAETPALLISAVHGLGGIGKTTLVSALAQEPRLKERFPDGLLWFTLGQKPDVLPGLSGWIQALGDYDFRPTNSESAANHLRTLLSDKVCLLVIDDAWQAEPVRLCLVGGKTCRMLITTREASLARKLGARLFNLDVMTKAQALALFATRLGDLGKQSTAASVLAKELGYLPLAIELAAAQIEGGRSWEELLEAFHTRLADLRALDLDEASFRNESLRLSFSLSLEALSEEEQQAFCWLGVLKEDASIGAKTAAILWQIPEVAARQRLLRFRDKALLKTLGEERFTIHDLLLDEARLRLQKLLPLEQAHLTVLQRYQAQCDPLPNALEKKAWHTLPVDGYIHAHLTWHLIEAGQGQAIHALMREETAEGKNGWYEACERSDQSAVFTNTLTTAWRMAEVERVVPLLVRYALIYASLAALGFNISPELMKLALENGLMSPGQALALMRHMPSPDQQAQVLEQIASQLPPAWLPQALAAAREIREEGYRAIALSYPVPHLPPALLPEALAAAREIQDNYHRAVALTLLAPHLPPELLPEALAIARGIQDEKWRVSALSPLTPHLPPELLPEVLAIARGIQDEERRASALFRLAPSLPDELLQDALEAARGIQDESYRAIALCGLVPHLPAELWLTFLPEALAAARGIQDEAARASALSELAPHLPPELLPDALAAARGIQDEAARARALFGMAPHLSAELRPVVLPEVLAAARGIQDESYRARALFGLVPHLPAELKPAVLNKALAAAWEIQDERARAIALSDLAPHLPIELRSEALSEALTAVREIQNENWRASSLSNLAPHLPVELQPAVLSEALAAARGIQDENAHARAMFDLVPHLPVEQQPAVLNEALAVAWGIQDESRRASALSGLSPHLPPELLPAVLSEALAAARGIQDEDAHASTLSSLAPHLPPELLPDALAAAQCIQDEAVRARALSDLAPHLPAELLPEVLTEALAAARGIQSEYYRASALSDLASHLPAELLPEVLTEALAAVRGIQNDGLRASALSNLAPHLQAEMLPEVLTEALATAWGIQDEADRARALSGLAPHLPAEMQPEVLTEALAAARGIQDEGARARALSDLAPHLPPELLPDALAAVQGIQNEDARASALSDMAPHLPAELLPDALAAARGIQNEADRASALSNLAPHLPPELLPEALASARGIQDEKWRASALSSLAPHLPVELRSEVLTEALAAAQGIRARWGFQDEADRADALSSLVPHLPPERLPEVLTQALKAIGKTSYITEHDQFFHKLDVPLQAFFSQGTRERFGTWCDLLNALSRRARPEFLSDLRSITGFTLALLPATQHEQAATEIYHAIQDVTRWWP